MIAKKPMMFKKFDFTLCYYQDFIFLLCGKNENKQIIKSCEKYDIINDKWIRISEPKYERYAASASVI